jgi:hypothetical protein
LALLILLLLQVAFAALTTIGSVPAKHRHYRRKKLPVYSTTFDPSVDKSLSIEEAVRLHAPNADRFIDRFQLNPMLQASFMRRNNSGFIHALATRFILRFDRDHLRYVINRAVEQTDGITIIALIKAANDSTFVRTIVKICCFPLGVASWFAVI